MGAYLFYVVCVSMWLALGWVLLARPVVLDRAWAGMQRLPLLVKPVVWVVFLPWLTGLAIWESGWRDPHARRLAVVLVAIAFISLKDVGMSRGVVGGLGAVLGVVVSGG